MSSTVKSVSFALPAEMGPKEEVEEEKQNSATPETTEYAPFAATYAKSLMAYADLPTCITMLSVRRFASQHPDTQSTKSTATR